MAITDWLRMHFFLPETGWADFSVSAVSLLNEVASSTTKPVPGCAIEANRVQINTFIIINVRVCECVCVCQDQD